MKILFFTTHKEPCGIADYAARLAQSLIAQGHEVTFFESPTKLFKLSKPRYWASMKSLRSLADKHDVLHVQHEFSFFKPWQSRYLGKLIGRRSKRSYKAIVTLHTTPKPAKPEVAIPEFWSRFFLWLYVKTLRFKGMDLYFSQQLRNFTDFDRILVHSKFGRNNLKKFHILDHRRIKVIPMPIQAPEGEPIETKKWQQAVKRLALNEQDKLLLIPGFISRAKGQIDAVKALSMLPINFKLILAGGVHPRANNCADANEIIDEIVQRNLQNRILYTGYLSESDMKCFAFKSNIVVLPYDVHYLSSSAVVGEALRYGKPVVATRTRGFLELAEVMSAIKLCDSASYADIARAILDSIEEPHSDPETIIREAHSITYDAVVKNMVDTIYSRRPVNAYP